MVATRRHEMKQQTRQRVIDAARELFNEKGFAAATIREIAVRAGVSTGSVFTTFESKEEILSVIILERCDELMREIEAAHLACPGDARERLKAGMAAAYAYEFDRLLLVVEQVGASWSWSKPFERSIQEAISRPFGFIREIVAEAKGEGLISPEVDPAILTDLLLGAYLRNFRTAWYRDLDLAHTIDMMRHQVDLVFDGAATLGRGPAAQKK